jgi:RNA-binding protein
MTLSGKHNRYLRALGHHLTPVVIIGKEGLTEEVLDKLKEELMTHELIKVKIGKGKLKRKEAVVLLSEKTGAQVVQLLGKTILLYLERKSSPSIKLPK